MKRFLKKVTKTTKKIGEETKWFIEEMADELEEETEELTETIKNKAGKYAEDIENIRKQLTTNVLKKAYCDQCEKYIGDDKLAWLSDRDQDLDFCSEKCYKSWENWTDIHPDFANKFFLVLNDKTYRQYWEEQELTYQQAKEYLSQGFTVQDFMFIKWLKDNKQLIIAQLNQDNIKSLRAEYKQTWIDLDADFAKARWGKTYQQIWEAYGINYSEAKEWVAIDLGPDKGNYDCLPYQWKNYGFTLQTTKEWLQAGLEKKYDYYLAAYARYKGYNPNNINREELVTEYYNWEKDTQEYLAIIYPPQRRKTITELDISDSNLTGELIINGEEWPKLEEIYLDNNNITSLELINCQQLTRIDGDNNNLQQLSGLPTSLTYLDLWNNNLTGDLTPASHLVNLEGLDIYNNKFTGSLAPLANCTKLIGLNINNTDIKEGLEYLPASLERFDCQNTKLSKQLQIYLKEGEEVDYDHAFLLKRWQTDQQELINQVQVLPSS